MAKKLTDLVKNIDYPSMTVVLPSIALRSITSKDGKGVYASSDTLYRGAVFGRDSLEVAEDLMAFKPRLVRSILLTLASLQGLEDNDLREEEAGKIIHEYRSTVVDGKPIGEKQLEIFRKWAPKWGGSDSEMIYYGSIDATPHFVRVLHTYCRKYGYEFLDRTVHQRNGQQITMREAAHNSCEWLCAKLKHSKSGLLEYHRINPNGLLNQVWKDSEEFYVHEDGSPANHDKPIASIEVQGLAYDALRAMAEFEPQDYTMYIDIAERLRGRMLDLLWQPVRSYFALGIDYDKRDKLRVISTKTANPAALLDTSIFDSLSDSERQLYVSSIVSTVLSDDFLTSAGIRSRALSLGQLVPFWDYHGSFVSWPKETYDIAKGLRRQGFKKLAHQLENRLLNTYLKNRRYPEFVYVDEIGRVSSLPKSGRKRQKVMVVHGPNNPERVQAWTVSAIISIMNTQVIEKVKLQNGRKRPLWQKDLEKQLLSSIPNVDLYVNPFSLSIKYPMYQYEHAEQGV